MESIRETRRKRLIRLREERCGGKTSVFAKKIEREPSYAARLFYPQGKPGWSQIGEKISRDIENSFGLPKYWLDGEFEDQTVINVELLSDLIAQALLSVRDSMHLIDPKYIGYKVVQIYLDNVEKGIDVSQARAVIDFILRHQEDVPHTQKNQSAEKHQKQHDVLRSG